MSGFTIGSFNLLKLGEQTVQQRVRDWGKISQIIRDQRIDILAVQEVFSEAPVQELVTYLNHSAFSTWEYRFAASLTCGNQRREGYAFIWNKKRISLLPKENGLFAEPTLQNRYSRTLVRPPYVGRFIPVGNCVPYIEIRIICTHIIFSENLYLKDKNNSLSDLELRKNEYMKLINSVYPGIADMRDGVFRPAYTFITGDYNLSLRKGQISECQATFSSKEMHSSQNKPTTLAFSPSSEQSSGYTDNDYDHFTCSGHEHPYIHSVDRIDGPQYFSGADSYSQYRKQVSDHVPIKMFFDVSSHAKGVIPQPLAGLFDLIKFTPSV